MTGQEFKAWFEGYIHGKGELTLDDIKIIQQKLSTIYDRVEFIPSPYPILPNYPYRPWYEPYPIYPTYTTPNTTGNATWVKKEITAGDFVLPPYGSNSADVRGV